MQSITETSLQATEQCSNSSQLVSPDYQISETVSDIVDIWIPSNFDLCKEQVKFTFDIHQILTSDIMPTANYPSTKQKLVNDRYHIAGEFKVIVVNIAKLQR